ncbi:MAG TPA: hypothetical protein VMT03_02165 [Polyangia bacterium]|nr:hypothetical protein [Polyangia bacterium]
MGWRRWMFVVLAFGAGGLACGGSPAWTIPQNPGSACMDPCATMTCPGGTHCAWNGRCQPRCDVDGPPNGWKP